MAALTVIAVTILMYIIQAVTGAALLRYVLVLLIGMTQGAVHLAVSAGQWIACLVVIESRVTPLFLSMTLVALGTELAFVTVILFVAVQTACRCLPIGLAGTVTGNAQRTLVCPFELKIGARVFELRLIELDDIRIASLMIGMATLTIGGCYLRVETVPTAVGFDISCYVFVTGEAQRLLRCVMQWGMTFFTLIFIFGMSIGQLARHDKGFQACGRRTTPQHQCHTPPNPAHEGLIDLNKRERQRRARCR